MSPPFNKRIVGTLPECSSAYPQRFKGEKDFILALICQFIQEYPEMMGPFDDTLG